MFFLKKCSYCVLFLCVHANLHTYSVCSPSHHSVSLSILHVVLSSSAAVMKKNKVSLTQYWTKFCGCELPPHQRWPSTHLESHRRSQVNAYTPPRSANEKGQALPQSSFLSPSLCPLRVGSILDVKGLTSLAYSARSSAPTLPTHPPSPSQ